MRADLAGCRGVFAGRFAAFAGFFAAFTGFFAAFAAFAGVFAAFEAFVPLADFAALEAFVALVALVALVAFVALAAFDPLADLVALAGFAAFAGFPALPEFAALPGFVVFAVERLVAPLPAPVALRGDFAAPDLPAAFLGVDRPAVVPPAFPADLRPAVFPVAFFGDPPFAALVPFADLPAPLAADLRAAPPLFVAPLPDRLVDFFVVAFFTLFFPANFLVVLLALRDVPAVLRVPDRLAADDRLPAARAFFVFAFFVFAFFVPDLPVAAEFVAAFFGAFLAAAFFAAGFLVAAFFVAAFFVAAFFVAAFFVAAGLRASTVLVFALPPPVRADRAGPRRAAGDRMVTTRAAAPRPSPSGDRRRMPCVPSDCSACPAFDVACEAMLTSRNAGMGRLPGWLSLPNRAAAHRQRRPVIPRHRR